MSEYIGGLFSSMTGSGSMIQTALQGVQTVSAGLMAIYRGKAEAAALRTQALAHEVDAGQRLLQGAEEARVLTEQLQRDLASARVAFAAGGTDTATGSGALVIRQAADRGQERIAMRRANRGFQARNLYRRAARKRATASIAKAGGWQEFLFGISDFAGDVARRGVLNR